MAFLDKLSKFTKDMGDKANDLMEIGKLNGKISTEKAAIETIKEQMGEYCWNKFQDGVTLDDQLGEYCASIQASLDAIADLQKQIDDLKAEKEVPAEETVPHCPACGSEVTADAKFCPTCGAKLEAPQPEAEEEPAPEEAEEEEAPAPLVCPQCGQENPAGTNFCSGCGSKLS